MNKKLKLQLLMEKKRRDCELDLLDFTKHFFKIRDDRFDVGYHHQKIADALHAVERGEIKNLVINIPPRYGKTELGVINWVARCLAINPKAKFIHLSYADDLALDNSSKAKELVESDDFQALWPIELKSDSKSKKKWYTTQGGGLYATSAGGAVTGFGAGSKTDTGLFDGAIIIDDPLKVDDAESELELHKVSKRLNTTIKSRRNNSSKTPIIIIMQRLHEEDMSGFALGGGMGEEFHHLNLPVIKDDGTALWPSMDSLEELEIQKNADIRTFSAQMMQQPSPEDGDFFRREWFKRYRVGSQPEALSIYGAADYAVSQGKGDFTELGVAGFDIKEDLYFLDWWSGQTSTDIWIEEQMRLAERHDPIVWVAEGGIIKQSIKPFLAKAMQSRKFFRTEWITSNKNKSANARSFQGMASQGKIFIPDTPWGDQLIEQLISFPYAKYDDKVDVCGLFGRIIDQAYSPSTIEKVEKSVYDAYETNDGDDDWSYV